VRTLLPLRATCCLARLAHAACYLLPDAHGLATLAWRATHAWPTLPPAAAHRARAPRRHGGWTEGPL